MHYKPDLGNLRTAMPTVTIGAELGEGGYKVAYRVQVKGRDEALKVVHIPSQPGDKEVRPENTRRLMRELELLAACTSPSLVRRYCRKLWTVNRMGVS